MAVTVGVPRETFPGERRVSLTPRVCATIQKSGINVIIESAAGAAAGFPDEQYVARGARVTDRAEVFREADIIAHVRALGANPNDGRSDIALLESRHTVVGFGEPLTASQESTELANTGASYLAMELVPRITRAQGLDALSSMATLAGYYGVLLAATNLPKMFPMLMTAAGTITPAKVFVLGAGVAGLQAIATAKRLGGVVFAYDLRPAVKEQVESVGAKFIVLDMETGSSEDRGGYAKAMGESFYTRQRELLTEVLREQDVVITTAAVPGRAAPILITSEMVAAMQPGSVIVDIAAERGGNCESTKPGETVVEHGVTIIGPLNIPSALARDASQMYASNIAALLRVLVCDGQLQLDRNDEIIREMLVTHEGQVVHPRVLETISGPSVANR